MRAILLRIVLEPFFSFQTVDGLLKVGLGIALIPWVVVAAVSIFVTFRKSRAAEGGEDSGNTLAEVGTSAGVFAAVPIGAYFFLRSHPEGIPVFGYGVMMFAGIIAATFFAVRNAKKLGLESDIIMDMLMWLVIPGIVGGRLFYIIQKHNEHGILKGKSVPEVLFALVNLPDGGLVFYGSIMGGVLGFLAFCFRRRLNILQMGDIVLPSVFVGLGFGRIGCFLYGCCFGGTCTLPWAVQFPKDSVPYAAQVGSGYITDAATTSLPLHPTQIYSSITAFMIATVLMLYLRHRPYNGSAMAIGWIIYPIARFVIEILRNDEVGQFGTDLTISQQISVGLFFSGLIFLVALTLTRGRFFGFNKSPLAVS